ncbi:protein trichome birefringence-like 4 [Macadamia integrifolia]|uniref:protein trichome birefringence-like 4 n=1 Tax=Macadamia integrifolia TaxID=60698 RepID=UPI001C502135|nr:protein trichome birefringence-like 4 [Macadamia integrifolia]XP_042482761.1 protein trichome birefringence-like 4 [Macadamia integrifolia]XP_042482762.1 protein trichome birefringence-like 4 [Macadamia integrifolia]
MASSVPAELSRNISWSLSKSRAQRYVCLIFTLALFLLLATAIITKTSPAAAASTLASRVFSRSGSSFYFYPTASSFETHIQSPPNPNPSPNPQRNHGHGDGNTSSVVVDNNPNSSSDGNASSAVKQNVAQVEKPNLRSRKTKTHHKKPSKRPKKKNKKHSNANASSATTAIDPSKAKTRTGKDLRSCDFYDGSWVVDDSPPAYLPGSCPFVEEAFNCFENGRVDDDFLRYRWQPGHCDIPRLDGKEMLDMLRGKRLAFVGDSLNRNMWESLVCVLRESVTDKNQVFEISGRVELKTEGFYSFRFEEYNCSIEFIRSPFLVEEWEFTDKRTGARKETLRLDVIEESAFKYQHADVLIFNTAHWWTHPKTSEGKDYYQEGNRVYSKLEMTEAYTKALHTWSKWIDDNVNANKTTIFFRGYSSSHFQGGQWNTGGGCDGERMPITDESYLTPHPVMMNVVESVLREMKTPVYYLNITKMTTYRKDAHPSIFREANTQRKPGMIQDCSHWCLPGLPDVWNQIVYALLLTTHHNPQYNSS